MSKTFEEIAQEYVRQFNMVSDPFTLVDSIADDIGTWRVGGQPLNDDQMATLMRLIREEFYRQGGIPAYIRDGTNAGSIDLVAMLAARAQAKKR